MASLAHEAPSPEQPPAPRMLWERPPPGRKVWQQLPPGPHGVPIAGSAFAFRRDPLGLLMRCYQTYGRAFTLGWFGYPAVFLIGPEANRLILVDQAANFLSRPAFTNLIPLLGEGVSVTDGALHARQRSLVSQAFRRARVEGYLPTMWEYATRYLDAWRPDQVVDADAAMHRLTMLIAARTLFGVDLAREPATLAEDFQGTVPYIDQPWPFYLLRVNLPFTPWGRFLRARERLDRFVYGLIRERQREDEGRTTKDERRTADLHPSSSALGRESKHDDVLTSLLRARDEDGGGLTTRQVRDQVINLLAAAHDPTALGVAWTLYLLARHPEARERAQAEVRAVLGGQPPTPEALGHLVYLDMAIKEALRLYPPSWAGARVSAAPFEFQGYRIPAGAVVVFVEWLSHRLPDVFQEPEAFRPERFHPEQGETHPPFAYLPFGGGARLCLGMTFGLQAMKVVLSALLSRWTLELEPDQRVEPWPAITLDFRYGIRMRVRPA